MFRSGGGGTGERKEKEHVVEDIRNKSSQKGFGGLPTFTVTLTVEPETNYQSHRSPAIAHK